MIGKDLPTCCDNPNIKRVDGFYVCVNCGLTHAKVYVVDEGKMFDKIDVSRKKQHEICNLKIRTTFYPETYKFRLLYKLHRSNNDKMYVRKSALKKQTKKRIENNKKDKNKNKTYNNKNKVALSVTNG